MLSSATYVINMPDLDGLTDALKNIDDLIDALKRLTEQSGGKLGEQRVNGKRLQVPAVIGDYTISWSFDYDIAITDIKYSQSAWKYEDNWDLVIDGEIVFESIFTKEVFESEHFNSFRKVSAGSTIEIVLHNESGNSRDIWTNLHYVTVVKGENNGTGGGDTGGDNTGGGDTGGGDIPAKEGYLRMFVATDSSDPDYVEPNSIENNYSKFKKYWLRSDGSQVEFNGVNISASFYDGRNNWLRDIFRNNISTINNITNYHKYLYKLYEDSKSGLVISQLENGYVSAVDYMNSIGITNKNEQMGIFMTYVTKCVNTVNNNFTSIYQLDGALDGFKDYIDRSKCFVFDWIDWADVVDTAAGGFANPIFVGSSSVYKAYLNIEPQIKDFSPIGNGCIWVLQYKYVAKGPELYRYEKLTEDPYDIYSWKNIREGSNGYDRVVAKYAMLGYVSIHEMGHAIDAYADYRGDTYRLSHTDEWLDIWKWTTVATAAQFRAPGSYTHYPKYLTKYHMEWDMSNGEPPITAYGCVDPMEDFAEAYVCYIMNEKYLKEKYPKRYAFMKKHVDTMKEVKV